MPKKIAPVPSLQAESGEVIRGSGNVFADLKLPDADEMFAKAELAVLIAKIIKSRKLTQRKAAELTGLSQSDISSIVGGRLVGISTWRLARALKALGRTVELHVTSEAGEEDLAIAL